MAFPNTIQTTRYHAPCGVLVLGSFEGQLCLCDWAVEQHRERVDARLRKELHATFEEADSPILRKAVRELDEYFAGVRTAFDLPLLFVGTDFQKRVWNHLLTIPYGHTVSYGAMAAALGVPGAVRAVANANGANALSIFAPCHRVIGTDGSLTGYGGGLSAKHYLLNLESRPLF